MEKVFHKTVVCGFYSIFSLPGYLILLIIPGMTIMNSGRILINPAMTVAPFAWEMLLAASNLWTITYKQRKNDKKARWKTIKWFFYWAVDVVRSLTDFRSSAVFVSILVEREFVYSIYFVEDMGNKVFTHLATITWSAHQYQMEPGVWPSKNPAQGM